MATHSKKVRIEERASEAARLDQAEDFGAQLESAKLRSLYQFAYGLSHEINNPLTNIATRAQSLMVDEQDPERRKKLAVIVQQAFRAHEMIADLMLFANPPAIRFEMTDLSKLADKVIAELKPLAANKRARLTRVGETNAVVANVDPVQIAVALKAVVQNALEAVVEKGTVEVRHSIASQELPSGSRSSPSGHLLDHPHRAVPEPKLNSNHGASPCLFHCLSVKDNGPGISAKTRQHIFDPYFSGREAGRGLGLGLSKAWRIVELHGGRIEVQSSEGGGAQFTIALPVAGDGHP